jgi:hypothetical protein
MIEVSTLPQASARPASPPISRACARSCGTLRAQQHCRLRRRHASLPPLAGTAHLQRRALRRRVPALRLPRQAVHRLRPAHPRRLHFGRRCDLADAGARRVRAGIHRALGFVALRRRCRYLFPVGPSQRRLGLSAQRAVPAARRLGRVRPLFRHAQACGIATSIKDLYWDVRPKPEFGTVEIRVCDTPLSIERATALAALAQALCRWLLRTRPDLQTARQVHVARYNKFQACRYGMAAMISDPGRARPAAAAGKSRRAAGIAGPRCPRTRLYAMARSPAATARRRCDRRRLAARHAASARQPE